MFFLATEISQRHYEYASHITTLFQLANSAALSPSSVSDHQIMHTGQNLSEILGNYYWKEMAIVSSKGETQYQHFLCITKRENKNYVIALTSQHNLTEGIRNVIPTLLGTFSWNH